MAKIMLPNVLPLLFGLSVTILNSEKVGLLFSHKFILIVLGEPRLIAQLPPDDESSCAFFFEWRTHVACPTKKPGSGVISILAAV